MRAILYARSATKWYPPSDQIKHLSEFAEKSNITVVRVISEYGAETTDEVFNLSGRDADCVLIYSKDRLGGKDIAKKVAQMHKRGIEVYALGQCLNKEIGDSLYVKLLNQGKKE